jgi:hypothetical protein
MRIVDVTQGVRPLMSPALGKPSRAQTQNGTLGVAGSEVVVEARVVVAVAEAGMTTEKKRSKYTFSLHKARIPLLDVFISSFLFKLTLGIRGTNLPSVELARLRKRGRARKKKPAKWPN